MGLGGFVPPYMDPNTTGDVLFRGVNYASGGGGILNQTGSIFVSILTKLLAFCVQILLVPPFHQHVPRKLRSLLPHEAFSDSLPSA